MAIQALDHYTVVTKDVDGMVRFFEDVIGLKVGARPPFKFPGAWLYCGDTAVLHLIEREPKGSGSAQIDHVAYRAEGYGELKARLAERNIEHREQKLAGADLTQVFIHCPEDLWVELIYQAEDVAAAKAA